MDLILYCSKHVKNANISVLIDKNRVFSKESSELIKILKSVSENEKNSQFANEKISEFSAFFIKRSKISQIIFENDRCFKISVETPSFFLILIQENKHSSENVISKINEYIINNIEDELNPLTISIFLNILMGDSIINNNNNSLELFLFFEANNKKLVI